MAENDGDDDLRQARTIVEQLDPLLKQSGWEFFQQMLQRQIDARRGRIPEASVDFGAVFKKEFEDGEVYGLMLAQRLAKGSLEAAKSLLEESKKQESDDES